MNQSKEAWSRFLSYLIFLLLLSTVLKNTFKMVNQNFSLSRIVTQATYRAYSSL